MISLLDVTAVNTFNATYIAPLLTTTLSAAVLIFVVLMIMKFWPHKKDVNHDEE